MLLLHSTSSRVRCSTALACSSFNRLQSAYTHYTIKNSNFHCMAVLNQAAHVLQMAIAAAKQSCPLRIAACSVSPHNTTQHRTCTSAWTTLHKKAIRCQSLRCSLLAITFQCLQPQQQYNRSKRMLNSARTACEYKNKSYCRLLHPRRHLQHQHPAYTAKRKH